MRTVSRTRRPRARSSTTSDNPFPVDLEVDPVSKDIFYVNIGDGTVNRISYASSNRAPTAVASATPDVRRGAALGAAQRLRRRPTRTATRSPTRGTPTATARFGDATGKTPTVTYTNGGTYQARLLVTDPGGLSSTSTRGDRSRSRASSGPTNTVRRRRSPGTPQVGGTLSVDDRHVDRHGADHVRAPVAAVHHVRGVVLGHRRRDRATYSPQLADQGKTIRVRVTATNAGGTSAALSTAVGPVTAGRQHAADAGHRHPGRRASRGRPATRSASPGTRPTRRTAPSPRRGCRGTSSSATARRRAVTRTRSRHAPGVASGTIAAPDHEAPSYIELTLTATDAAGATASVGPAHRSADGEPDVPDQPGGLSLAVGRGPERARRRSPSRGWSTRRSSSTRRPAAGFRGATAHVHRAGPTAGGDAHDQRAGHRTRTYTAIVQRRRRADRSVRARWRRRPGPDDGARLGLGASTPTRPAPASVHVYVDGSATVLTANTTRSDVGARRTASTATRHGFNRGRSRRRPAPTRCASTASTSPALAGNTTLGCRTVTHRRLAARLARPGRRPRRVPAGRGVGASIPTPRRADTVHVYVDGDR